MVESILPDATAIRDTLRGIRYVLRHASWALHSLPAPPMSVPGRGLARRAVQDMAVLDRAASAFLSRVLSTSASIDFSMGLEPEIDASQFAAAFYWASQHFFRRFDVPDQLISERTARKCYAAARSQNPASIGHFAALLVQALLGSQTVCGVMPRSQVMSPEEARPMALFTAILWMVCERDGDDPEQLLLAAQDLAMGLREEIVPVLATKNVERLAELFDDLVQHV